MAIGELRCKLCPAMFVPSAGQVYCSMLCRQKARKFKLYEESSAFERLPIYLFPPEQEDALVKLGGSIPQNRVQILLHFYAPAGAVGFRLGCSNRKPRAKFPQVHWFPTISSRTPAMFLLGEGYEHPHLPYPGIYIVAYFSSDGHLIGDPTSRIAVEAPIPPHVRWSHGDENIHLGSKGYVVL